MADEAVVFRPAEGLCEQDLLGTRQRAYQARVTIPGIGFTG